MTADGVLIDTVERQHQCELKRLYETDRGGTG